MFYTTKTSVYKSCRFLTAERPTSKME